MSIIDRPDALAATAVENGIVAVSLELSRSKWLLPTCETGNRWSHDGSAVFGVAPGHLRTNARTEVEGAERL
jgi:hypothetical protein